MIIIKILTVLFSFTMGSFYLEDFLSLAPIHRDKVDLYVGIFWCFVGLFYLYLLLIGG